MASENAGWIGDAPLALVGLEILGASIDCVKVIALDGTLVSMNVPGMTLMQIDRPDQVLHRPWPELWPQPDRPVVTAALAGACRGEVTRFTAMCPTTKGVQKWWDVAVSPIRDRDGTVGHILAISRDVTEHKLLDERLQASERRFRALADNIAQFAWMADGSGYIFWYNQRWYDYTGTSLSDMAGWGWTQVHHPDHVDRVVAKIKNHFESGEAWEDTFPLRSADGQYRWFLSRALPIRAADGRITLWCGTNTDIEEQRHTSRRLRQKARMIALSHEAILSWDMHHGIETWNRGCQELYGYDVDEVVGKSPHEILRTRHSLPNADFEALLRRDGSWSGELVHIDKDGREIWVDSRQELLLIEGREIVLETNRDITERRRSDEMKRLLLAELDHRVKNTLAVVQVIASQTARRASTQHEFTRSFNARLQSLARAHDLLVDSRWTGAGLRDLVLAQVTLGDDADSHVTIRGDNVFIPAQTSLQLSLVMFELATNARRHGALSIPSGKLEISWEVRSGPRPMVGITWQESEGPRVHPPASRGFGISLIERTGSQSNLVTKMDFASTGLVCRIDADISAQHRGPTTYFDTRAEANRNKRFRSLETVVLIIEDEPLISLELEDIVAGEGYTTMGPVASVDAAIDLIQHNAPDIALLDGSLSGDAVDRVVDELQRRSIPFAMITGFTPESLPSTIDPQATPILKKPVEAREIARVLQQLTKR